MVWTDGTVDTVTGHTSRTRVAVRLLTWLMALVLGVALCICAYFAVTGGVGRNGDEAARLDALSTTERFIATMSSFDPTAVDAYKAAVGDQLDGGLDNPCWATVGRLVPAAADPAALQAARRNKARYESRVVESGVESSGSENARTLAAVDLGLSAEVNGQRVSGGSFKLRLRFDLTDVDGDWKIKNCTVLAAPAYSSDTGGSTNNESQSNEGESTPSTPPTAGDSSAQEGNDGGS